MRVRSLIALAAAAIAPAAAAQPYGVLQNTPGYWKPLGQFENMAVGDQIYTGKILAFTHPAYNAGPHSFSTIWVAMVYDHEQLKPGHGSYWQVLTNVMYKCQEHTFRVTQAQFYDKLRVEIGADMADVLWKEQMGPQNSADGPDDKYFQPVVGPHNALIAAVEPIACSEPEGMN
jgi:hypothetical protein